jgi:hypothetical protein
MCFIPLMKLAFPAHAWNAEKAQQITCTSNTRNGPVVVAYGSQCVTGGTVCASNDCPGNSSPQE